jgi:hypothetical protein
MNEGEVARLNWHVRREHTDYLTTPTVRELFERCFSRVEFREELFPPVYRNCWNRAMLMRR